MRPYRRSGAGVSHLKSRLKIPLRGIAAMIGAQGDGICNSILRFCFRSTCEITPGIEKRDNIGEHAMPYFVALA
jgi:hypothetical protein